MKKLLVTLLACALILCSVAGAESTSVRVASHNAVVEGNAYRVPVRAGHPGSGRGRGRVWL